MRFFHAVFRIKNGREIGLFLGLVLVLAATTAVFSAELLLPGEVENLDAYTTESEAFRRMDFGEDGLWEMREFAEENGLDFAEVVTTTMICYDYQFSSDFAGMTAEALQKLQAGMVSRKPEAYEKCLAQYRALLQALACFPVPRNAEDEGFVTYENSWRYERTFGGERTHEGTDLMAGDKPRGYYPVLSISAGTVESVGWLKLGGWRIGVRSDTGVYFYYAHLDTYAQEWQVGDHVAAGQLLGFMGDSGYSEVEGTTGMFPVHLHLGIYLATDHFQELSVNPYFMLTYLEHFLTEAAY